MDSSEIFCARHWIVTTTQDINIEAATSVAASDQKE